VQAADALYDTLSGQNIDVIYDDRDVRAGEKFADADLLGIPLRVVVSAKTLETNQFEVKKRTANETQLVSEAELLKMVA